MLAFLFAVKHVVRRGTVRRINQLCLECAHIVMNKAYRQEFVFTVAGLSFSFSEPRLLLLLLR